MCWLPDGDLQIDRTVYDMVKAADKAMTIGDFRLVRKTGGRSGDDRRR